MAGQLIAAIMMMDTITGTTIETIIIMMATEIMEGIEDEMMIEEVVQEVTVQDVEMTGTERDQETLAQEEVVIGAEVEVGAGAPVLEGIPRGGDILAEKTQEALNKNKVL